MAQVPGSGSLDQVLRLLSLYALTPAYNAVLADTVAIAAPAEPSHRCLDCRTLIPRKMLRCRYHMRLALRRPLSR